MTEITTEEIGSFEHWRDVIDSIDLDEELEEVTGRPIEDILENGINSMAEGVLIEELLERAEDNYILQVSGRAPAYTILQVDFKDQSPAKEVIKHPEDPVAKCPGCGYDTSTSYSINGEQQETPEYATGICGDCFAGMLCDSSAVVYQ